MGLVKLNDRGVRSATTFGSVSGGSFTFIKKLTASASATLSFVDGASDVVLDDTYKEYLFTFNNIHGATDNERFQFQANIVGGADYNETMTTTVFRASHDEADTDTGVSYITALDQAQGTAFQTIGDYVGADADQSLSGSLSLFNPASTTFVKHFISRFSTAQAGDFAMDTFVSGYINTTSAIDDIQFKMSSGNIDAGDICLYGIK